MPFFCQQFIDGDCRLIGDVVVVQHPSACNAWSHTCHPFSQSFKDFPIKSLIDRNVLWERYVSIIMGDLQP